MEWSQISPKEISEGDCGYHNWDNTEAWRWLEGRFTRKWVDQVKPMLKGLQPSLWYWQASGSGLRSQVTVQFNVWNLRRIHIIFEDFSYNGSWFAFQGLTTKVLQKPQFSQCTSPFPAVSSLQSALRQRLKNDLFPNVRFELFFEFDISL